MPARGRRPHSGVIATGEVLSFHRHCRRHREAKKTLARQGTWTVPPEVSQIAHQRLQFDMDKIQGMVKQQRQERQKSPKSRIQVVYSIFRDPTTRATSCGMGSQCGLIYTSNVGKELRAHLMAERKIKIQNIKIQSRRVIGQRGIRLPGVILIFRKIRFEQEVLGDFISKHQEYRFSVFGDPPATQALQAHLQHKGAR